MSARDKFHNIAKSALQTLKGSDPRLIEEVGDLFVRNSCKDCYIIQRSQINLIVYDVETEEISRWQI